MGYAKRAIDFANFQPPQCIYLARAINHPSCPRLKIHLSTKLMGLGNKGTVTLACTLEIHRQDLVRTMRYLLRRRRCQNHHLIANLQFLGGPPQTY